MLAIRTERTFRQGCSDICNINLLLEFARMFIPKLVDLSGDVRTAGTHICRLYAQAIIVVEEI